MPSVSLFTPSHNPRFLDEVYDSLLTQTRGDWEWIVLLNNGASWAPPVDDRVKVHTAGPVPGVGAAKKLACSYATAEILVELDHDDLLLPAAVEAIVAEFEQEPGASLVYSDFAQMNEDGSPNFDEFDPGPGWRYHDEDKWHVCEALPATPHNVSYIWYAPNHVRAFRREAYEQVGGYDGSLGVVDDQDLMCRLYQAGDFAGIPELLYLQRIHPAMTQKVRNAEIQVKTVELYDRYVQDNALAWAARNKLLCLDLGGAHNSPPAYVPVDWSLGSDAHRVLHEHAGRVGVIRAVDFLEHNDALKMMTDIWRALAPGGMLLSMTPSTDGRGAFCDPTHISFWNELSFRYYTDPEYSKYLPVPPPLFRLSRLATVYPSPWHEDNQVPYVLSNLVKE